ncbi:MAG: M48 family metallopeptidase [Deltaproteobacteria bacterium]|nr:M48 family metallopeptidase [Deltaproteobacteria bacterium]
MNTIAVIILFALVFDLVVNAAADYLNLKALRPDLPREFQGLYDAPRYRRAQDYLKVNTRFGWLVSFVNLLVLLVFWFGGGFALLDEWVRSWHLGPVPSGLAYIGILSLLAGSVSLPFSVYATFVIEARFGFNQTTWATFFKDRLKGLALALVLGGPLLAAVLAFFEYAGHFAWLYGWAAVTLFMLVMQFVAPTWIMPLFNRFSPLPEGRLRQAIFSYARSIDFPLDNIHVMDGSRRSRKSNAFFTGFGRHKRIVLFDTLVEKHTVEELVAVLAHEMGHYKKKHIQKSLLAGIVQSGLMFFLLSFFISEPALFEAFYVRQPSVYAGLVFFALVYAPLGFLSGLLMQAFSRRNEFAADRFAVDTTRAPDAMASALKKLAVDNLTNLTPHRFYVFLNYSHPPVLQRLQAIANRLARRGGLNADPLGSVESQRRQAFMGRTRL